MGLILGFGKSKKVPPKFDREGVIQIRQFGGGFIVKVRRRDKEGKLIQSGLTSDFVTLCKCSTRKAAEQAYKDYQATIGKEVNNITLRSGYYSPLEYLPVPSKMHPGTSPKVIFFFEDKQHQGYYSFHNKTFYAEIPSTLEIKAYPIIQMWKYQHGNKHKPIPINSTILNH